MYKVECLNENETKYVKNVICELKSISRGINALTWLYEYTVPLNYIMANYEVVQKSSSNSFVNVVFNSTFEVCSGIESGDFPPIYKLAMPLLKNVAKDFLRKCPWLPNKQFGMKNLTVDVGSIPLISIVAMQRGEYRVSINYRDKNNDFICWIKIYIGIIQKRYQKVTKKQL